MRVELKEAPPPAPRVAPQDAPNANRVYLIILYVAVVLLVDTLAANRVYWIIDWSMFSWTPIRVHLFSVETLGLPPELTQWMAPKPGGYRNASEALNSFAYLFSGFSFFKFIFWLLIPLAFSLRRFDAAWWGWRRIKRPERWLLLAAPFVALAAMFLIPYLPGVSDYYQQARGQIPWQGKVAAFIQQNVYIVSWLIGWEFLHRYVLLRAAGRRWPRVGWLLVPLAETLYHLQKPWVETGAMCVYSLCMTQYARRRRNALWPLLVHWIIENALFVFIFAV